MGDSASQPNAQSLRNLLVGLSRFEQFPVAIQWARENHLSLPHQPPHKGGWLYSTPPLHLTLYALHLSPLTHTRLSCARRWFAVFPCLSPAKGSVLTQMPLGRCISATSSACQNRSPFRRTMISSQNISNSSERTQSFCKTQKLFGATACQSRT